MTTSVYDQWKTYAMHLTEKKSQIWNKQKKSAPEKKKNFKERWTPQKNNGSKMHMNIWGSTVDLKKKKNSQLRDGRMSRVCKVLKSDVGLGGVKGC